MADPLVSIIVPYYNSRSYVGRLIDSFRNQSFSNFECLLVDDGSKDDSFQMISTLISGDDRFTNHRRPDTFAPGGRGAKNHGFELSHGKYIVFFDSDDVMYEDFLASRVESLETNPGIGAVFSDMGWKVREGNRKRIYRYHEGLMSNLRSKVLDDRFWIEYMDMRFFFTPGNFMWRRDAIEGRPLWHESTTIGEDYEFHCRKFIDGLETGYIPRPTWDYMANEVSMMATSETVGSLLGRSFARMLVIKHLMSHLGSRPRLIRKELVWQVKILRRMVACRSKIVEKRSAMKTILGRINELMKDLGHSTARRMVILSGLFLTAVMHLTTGRFYGLYSFIVSDRDSIDHENRFTIS